MNIKTTTTSSIRKVYDLIGVVKIVAIVLVALLSCGLIFL